MSKPIFKTWKKATYFQGIFELRDENQKWGTPIEFPTVFIAYGKSIKSGNWLRYTSINTPNFVIDNFFDTVGNNIHDEMYMMWTYCKKLERITCKDVKKNKTKVLELIKLANCELSKLKVL